jgi:CelD/BcsL family acetyltransferase involved in cellulose biosynthesis
MLHWPYAAPSRSAERCTIETLDTEAWRELRQRMSPDTAFLSGAWIEAWAAHYLPHGHWRGPCRYLSVHDAGGRLAGVLPLATMRFGPIEFYAGGGYFLPYRSVPLAVSDELSESACAALADALIGRMSWRLGLRLGPMSDHDAACRRLAAALRKRGWRVGMRRLGQSFVLDLPSSHAAFKEQSEGLVKRVMYYERRLRREGQLQIAEHRALDRTAWNTALADVAAIEKRSWLAAARESHLLFGTESDRRFWVQVAEDEGLAPALAIWLIRFDGQPICFAVTLDAGRRTFVLANLYDERFKLHSPGNLLSYYVFSRAIEKGQATIDWGLGDSGYKQRWGAQPRETLCDLLALPPGPLGRAAAWAIERCSSFRFG